MFKVLSKAFTVCALLLPATVVLASSISLLPDGTPVNVGDKNGVPLLEQWAGGRWEPIAVAPELVPAKGEFNEVTGDPQGNLYVTYADKGNEKRTTYGLLARVNGAWARLGELDKGWTTGGLLAAASPNDVHVAVWLTKERRRELAHWDGRAYTLSALPAGT